MSKDNHAQYTDEAPLGELGLVLMILVLDTVEHIMMKIKSIFIKDQETPVAYNWGDYDGDEDEMWFEEAD